MHQCCVLFSRSLVGLGGEGFCLSVLNYVLLNKHSWGGRLQLEEPEAWATVLSPFWADDDCFYYHSWRNNVAIAFGTLLSFLT